MKKKLIYALLLIVLFAFTNASQAQLANSYHHDVGIEKDPNVLFVEKFDDGMTNILSRYNDKLNTDGMSIENDVPEGSQKSNSLKMTSITGGVRNGGYLFKQFSPGFDSVVYVRYYVKYPSSSNGYFHHEGVWFGGYNPSINYPFPKAGTCGLGDSRLSISYEPVWKHPTRPGMDTYLYWGGMHSYDGGSTCYGNPTINQGRTSSQSPISGEAPLVMLDQWMCIEIMIKLNNPVTAHNGELKVWQDGVAVGHWGPGFPNGHWLKDKWYNNLSDPAFEGFQWRTDAALNINWLWFEFYHDDPNAPSSHIKFANLVVAKKYIGPISNPTGAVNLNDSSSEMDICPNPSSGTFLVTGITPKSRLTVFNVLGEKIFSCNPVNNSTSINISDAPKGIYFVKVEGAAKNYSRTIILE